MFMFFSTDLKHLHSVFHSQDFCFKFVRIFIFIVWCVAQFALGGIIWVSASVRAWVCVCVSHLGRTGHVLMVNSDSADIIVSEMFTMFKSVTVGRCPSLLSSLPMLIKSHEQTSFTGNTVQLQSVYYTCTFCSFCILSCSADWAARSLPFEDTGPHPPSHWTDHSPLGALSTQLQLVAVKYVVFLLSISPRLTHIYTNLSLYCRVGIVVFGFRKSPSVFFATWKAFGGWAGRHGNSMTQIDPVWTQLLETHTHTKQQLYSP